MSIVHIPDEFKKEFKVAVDGKASTSIRGAARILGVDESTIRENRSAGQKTCKYAEYLAKYGFDSAGLKEKRITDIELALMAKYHAYKAKESDRSEQAEMADIIFSAIGVRVWIQQQLGYGQAQKPSRKGMYDLVASDLELISLYLKAKDLGILQKHKDMNWDGIMGDIPRELWDMSFNVLVHLMANLRLESESRSLFMRNMIQSFQRRKDFKSMNRNNLSHAAYFEMNRGVDFEQMFAQMDDEDMQKLENDADEMEWYLTDPKCLAEVEKFQANIDRQLVGTKVQQFVGK